LLTATSTLYCSVCSQLKRSHELAVSDLTQRSQILSVELSSYASREPEYLLVQKTLQGKLDRAEIEVKRLTRQYEAARKKADFLESQSAGVGGGGGGVPQPLQPSLAIMNQATTSTNGRPGSSGPGASYLQPIPFAQSLLPPSFAKKV
jgi:hypothetical protein